MFSASASSCTNGRTGTHPFAADTIFSTTARIVGHVPRPMDAIDARIPVHAARVVERCLQKAPEHRFTNAGEIAAELDRDDPLVAPVTRAARWWRIHQVASVVLYATACVFSWQFNDWEGVEVTRAAFFMLGVLATAGGVMRGHLLFTERTRGTLVHKEQRRTRRPLMMLDLVFGAVFFLDALQLESMRVLPAVVAMALALAIALSTVLIEPATTSAAFDSAS